MNQKEMVVPIIVSMVVIAMLASTATAIVVDGDESDWIGLPGVKSIEDPVYDIYVTPPGGPDYYINWDSGYEFDKFAIYYNASTDALYFKFNTTGVPGDTDGDGDPNGCTNYSRAVGDAFEVSVGNFMVLLDVIGDEKYDYKVIYTNDSISVKKSDGADITPNFTTEHSIGRNLTPPYENAVVEISICPAHNLTGFGDCDKSINVTEARCGSANDYCSEDSVVNLSVNEPPVPIPNGTYVCFCTNTTFDGSGSYDPDGEIVSWKWDFGDGEAGSGETTSHHYGNDGTYNVTLTVTDDFGINCSATITVVVYENPIANFTATVEYFCTATQFTDATTNGTLPYTYAWDFGDGNSSTEQNPTNHYPAPGTYNACLNVTDEYGCTDGICKDVHVIPKIPPVAIPNGTNVCYCTNTTFNGSASYDPDGTIVSWKWDFGDGETGSGETTSHHYDAPNGRTYTVTLTVTDNDGDRNSSTITVDVYENPTVVANASEYIVAPGTAVTFSGTVSGGTPPYTCTWTIGETIYPGIGPHTVTINELTTATLNVVDDHDCPGTDSVTVRIKRPPGPGGAAVPVMSPFGIAALVGLLGLIGAGMIRKRR